MSEKKYAIAQKRGGGGTPPAEDLKERLARIEGVSVLGSTRNRAQFTASDEAAERVRSELGDSFHVEEVVERKIL